METLKQCSTKLNTLYFSEFNTRLVHNAIRQNIRNKTGIAIDYQNKNDLFAIMRVVFINNSSNPYGNECAQVHDMNAKTIQIASDQIITNLSQYSGYLKDASMYVVPVEYPVNTSTAGNKITGSTLPRV
jgi:hypothetical protein